MKEKRITLAAGEALIDWIVNTSGKVHEVSLYEKKVGGAPLNVAIAINLFGGHAKLYSAVGGDTFGLQIKNDLKPKLDTSNIVVKNDKMTTMAFVSLDENGDRSFEFNRAADKHLHIRDISKIDMKRSEIFLFSGAMPLLGGAQKSTYEYLLDYGVKHNKFIAFDPNYRSFLWDSKEEFNNEIKPYIEGASIIKIGDEELEIVTGESDIENGIKELRKRTKAIICVTRGKDGATISVGDHIENIPNPIKVDVVDTTGAGDAFFGTLLGLLSIRDIDLDNLEKDTLFKLVEKALFVAAMSTTKKGALMENPGIEDLL